MVRFQGSEGKMFLGLTVQSNRKEVRRRALAGWRKVSDGMCDKRESPRMKGKVRAAILLVQRLRRQKK